MVVGDYDLGRAGAFERAVARAKAVGLLAVFHTTPSYTAAAPRYRVIAPLSRAHPPSEHARLTGLLNAILTDDGADLSGLLSNESFTLSQSFYIGRVRGVPYLCDLALGAPLDTLPAREPCYTQVDGSSSKGGDRVPPPTEEQCIAAILAHSAYHDLLRALTMLWRRRDGLDAEGLYKKVAELGARAGAPPPARAARFRDAFSGSELERLVEGGGRKKRHPPRNSPWLPLS